MDHWINEPNFNGPYDGPYDVHQSAFGRDLSALSTVHARTAQLCLLGGHVAGLQGLLLDAHKASLRTAHSAQQRWSKTQGRSEGGSVPLTRLGSSRTLSGTVRTETNDGAQSR